MKSICFWITLSVVTISCVSFGYGQGGIPLKYIGGCEIDIDNNKTIDLVLLLESSNGWELLVLRRLDSGYKVHQVTTGKTNMNLQCKFGTRVNETRAGKSAGRVHTTNGTYLLLSQPESSSVAYFWKNNGFIEVWTSD